MDKLRAFYKFNGKGEQFQDVSQGMIQKYATQLPNLLIDLWKRNGLSSFNNGFLWFVDPDEYAPILTSFIGASENDRVLIRTAMGGLIIMNTRASQSDPGIKIFRYLCPIYKEITPMTSDFSALLNGWLTSEDIFGPLMFYNFYQMARETLDKPAPDECYGFVPAIALGGDLNANHLKIVNLKEHLLFLAQLE